MTKKERDTEAERVARQYQDEKRPLPLRLHIDGWIYARTEKGNGYVESEPV